MAVIVLTGMPATGKSTICKYLTESFGYPVVEKDAIKEQLFDTIGFQSYPEKRRLDHAANAIVLHMTEQLLRAGQSVIIDNNFDDISQKAFRELTGRYQMTCMTVFLKGNPDVLYERYVKRDKAHARHLGHILQEHYPPREGDCLDYAMTRAEFEDKFLKRGMDHFFCPGGRIEVDTSDFEKVNPARIVEQIQEYFALLSG